jgi:hypothetical protein
MKVAAIGCQRKLQVSSFVAMILAQAQDGNTHTNIMLNAALLSPAGFHLKRISSASSDLERNVHLFYNLLLRSIRYIFITPLLSVVVLCFGKDWMLSVYIPTHFLVAKQSSLVKKQAYCFERFDCSRIIGDTCNTRLIF